ncbi:hypothetical protein [Tsukamurella soli]|uniref:hypothetical protein n=1 Tax=Tsukamurella soli TaxID=644556 RepID=UPI00361F6BF0
MSARTESESTGATLAGGAPQSGTSGGEPALIEEVYLRGSDLAGTEFGAAVTSAHLSLAARRAPGQLLVRAYRTDDPVGPALQVVVDDMPLLVATVSDAARESGGTVVDILHPLLTVTRAADGALVSAGPDRLTDAAAPDGELRESWIHVRLGADTDAPCWTPSPRPSPSPSNGSPACSRTRSCWRRGSRPPRPRQRTSRSARPPPT